MDLIVSMYEMVLDKKGKGTIEDALNVMDEVDKREAERKKLL